MSEVKLPPGPRFELALVHSAPARAVRRNATLGPERGVPVRVVSRQPEA